MSLKKSDKSVAVIFTLPAKVKSTLDRKIKSGGRSRFVAELIAKELGVVSLVSKKKIATKSKKNMVKKTTTPKKKKKLFGGIFK